MSYGYQGPPISQYPGCASPATSFGVPPGMPSVLGAAFPPGAVPYTQSHNVGFTNASHVSFGTQPYSPYQPNIYPTQPIYPQFHHPQPTYPQPNHPPPTYPQPNHPQSNQPIHGHWSYPVPGGPP
ncbi:uncharacterized protein LOC143147595 [Ptiloglossa arizonensis]|uniref:uncharacterized protein LOC143147595 n=1 Tax=Ptiloglossa arizonensis TaxID=3350558 RepID=UPI003FA17374